MKQPGSAFVSMDGMPIVKPLKLILHTLDGAEKIVFCNDKTPPNYYQT